MVTDKGSKNGENLLDGTYRIIGKIGAGGNGIVYKAYHERLKINVVLKKLRDRAGSEAQNRSEADVLKRLKHTYLPRVYDFLEVDGGIYTVMDFIPGESLKESLKKQPRFAQKQVFQWAIQLAMALDYLHSQKPPIIHSDIKPGNIMLMPSGDICLIDFNISLAFHPEGAKSTGISGGYAPPEQYHNLNMYRRMAAMYASSDSSGTTESLSTGDSNRTVRTQIVEAVVGRGVDERSDIYSLGATLYHLLTGIRPGMDFEQIVPVSRFDIHLSQGFALVIEKMMELDPARRYQNGAELLYALEHIYEIDIDYRNYCRRRWVSRFLIAGLYLAGGLLTAAGVFQIRRETVVSYNRSVALAGDLLEEEEYEKAGEEIERAVKLLPTQIDAYVKELQRLYQMGEYEQAVQYARDVINNPSYTLETDSDIRLLGDLYYLLGNVYIEQEDYGNAVYCLEEAIKQNRKNSLYFRDDAIALAKTGNVDQAEEMLKEAVELGLGEDSIYMVQGEIAYTKGEYEAAAEYLTVTIRTASDPDLFRRSVLLCAQSLGKLGEEGLNREISFLEEMEGQFSGNTSMHLTELLAEAYAQKARNDTAGSVDWYEKALKKFTDLYDKGYSSRQTMENLAVIYQEINELDEAENVLLQIAEQYPEDYRAYKRLAFLQADVQQSKENLERDYTAMREYYNQAVSLYEQSGAEGDTEMQMLESMMRDLEEGGWF